MANNDDIDNDEENHVDEEDVERFFMIPPHSFLLVCPGLRVGTGIECKEAIFSQYMYRVTYFPVSPPLLPLVKISSPDLHSLL